METSCKQTASYQNKIIKQIKALPDKIPTFSKFEDDILRAYYPTKGGPAMAKVLGKKLSQIKQRVQVLGIKRLRR